MEQIRLLSSSRHIVCSSPRRRIFNVIVPGHVLCCDVYFVARLLGQQQSSRQTGNTSTVHLSDNGLEGVRNSAYPIITMFLDITALDRGGVERESKSENCKMLSCPSLTLPILVASILICRHYSLHSNQSWNYLFHLGSVGILIFRRISQNGQSRVTILGR